MTALLVAGPWGARFHEPRESPEHNAFQLRPGGGVVASRSKDWTVRRTAGRELYVAPDGSEYVRAWPDTATAAIDFRTRLGESAVVYLRPESSERLEKVEARAVRRAEKRDNARKARTCRPATEPVTQEDA